MEKNAKHRLLGVMVVLAIMLVLSAFFFSSNKDTAPEVTAVNSAPPFPDQSVQVSENDIDEGEGQTQTIASSIPIRTIQSDANSSVNQQPDDTIRAAHPSMVNTQTVAAQSAKPAAATPSIENNLIPTDNTKTVAVPEIPRPPVTTSTSTDDLATDAVPVTDVETTHAVKPKTLAIIKKATHEGANVKTPKMKLAEISATQLRSGRLDSNGLFKLKNSAWVIQLGSFKNKTNAIRLVNRLRSKGYSAFIQQVADNTRVYVGPEGKQDTARLVASQLKQEVQMQGIVISYKPLAL